MLCANRSHPNLLSSLITILKKICLFIFFLQKIVNKMSPLTTYAIALNPLTTNALAIFFSTEKIVNTWLQICSLSMCIFFWKKYMKDFLNIFNIWENLHIRSIRYIARKVLLTPILIVSEFRSSNKSTSEKTIITSKPFGVFL